MGIADLCLMTDHLGLACLQGNLSGPAESGLAAAQRQFTDYLDGLLMVGIVLHLSIYEDAVVITSLFQTCTPKGSTLTSSVSMSDTGRKMPKG